MKWIVGYPCSPVDGFIDRVIELASDIKELYFSWGDIPNGRSSGAEGITLFEKMSAQLEDLRKTAAAGIGHNLLLNAACYGERSQSRAFFYSLGDTVEMLKCRVGLSSVTTSSLLIAKFIKENFPSLDVRASVNMGIGTVEGISYVEKYFDSFYLKRELNRDIKALSVCRERLNGLGKGCYILANSGCLNHCSAHAFHDNLVAHEGQIAAMDNGYSFTGVCREYIEGPDGAYRWLERTSFIRPEDIGLYEPYADAVKLATRVNPHPTRVLDAYVRGGYQGSAMELLEPDHSSVIYPRYLDNSLIPSEHMEYMTRCDKRCEECGRCRRISEKATVTLGEDTAIKI